MARSNKSTSRVRAEKKAGVHDKERQVGVHPSKVRRGDIEERGVQQGHYKTYAKPIVAAHQVERAVGIHISEQYEAWNQQKRENLEHPRFVDLIEKSSSRKAQSYHNESGDGEKPAHFGNRIHSGLPLHKKENGSIAKIKEKIYREQEYDPGVL